MNNIWNLLTKIGSGLIVILLVIMLAITFSSQPIDEIISLISGSSKAGSYNNEPILIKDYMFIYNECENQFQRYGLTEIPPFLLQNCIFENVQSLYVKPDIADDLGLNVSKESIEKQIADYVQQIYQIQKNSKLEDDVIPIEELYQRELSSLPISKRIAFIKANMVDQFLLRPIPISNDDWNILQSIAKDSIELNLELIAFTNQDLLDQIQVNVSEEEIQKKYEEDKLSNINKENKTSEYPSYQERYKFIKESLQNEKKRAILSNVKEQLSKINQKPNITLKEIEDLVKIKAVNKTINLKELDSLVVGNKKINLLQNEFLKSILTNNQNIVGPIQDKENTIYVRLMNIKLKENNKEIQVKKESFEERLAFVFYNHILEQYRKRGNFQVKDLTKKGK
ncbi:MAG: hypothetical protein N2247_01580 [Leptospiraceae bacterium]|jgi:hypothetical protein|nr:hypothetical protein [Leptospiraceae bacterium]